MAALGYRQAFRVDRARAVLGAIHLISFASFLVAPCRSLSAQDNLRNWVEARRLATTAANRSGILLNPTLITGVGDDYVVFDAGDFRVKRLGADGKLVWQQGRNGGGPGEYRHVVDVHALGDGLVAILDEGNRRVTFLDGNGAHLGDVKVGAGAAKIMRIAPPNRADLLQIREWNVLYVGDDRGDESGMWAPRSSEELLLSEVAVPARSSVAEVVAFRWNSTIVVRQNGQVSSFTAIDSVGTPTVLLREVPGTRLRVKRVDPRAREVTWAVGINGKCVVVLGPHAGDDSTSVLDYYQLDGFQYLNSQRISGEATQMVIMGNRVAILALDPEPAVEGYALPSGC